MPKVNDCKESQCNSLLLNDAVGRPIRVLRVLKRMLETLLAISYHSSVSN